MHDVDPTRRNLGLLADGGALAAVTLSARSASACQGDRERALCSLHEAPASLREASPNKGGRRERAIKAVQQALSQVQAGAE